MKLEVCPEQAVDYALDEWLDCISEDNGNNTIELIVQITHQLNRPSAIKIPIHQIQTKTQHNPNPNNRNRYSLQHNRRKPKMR